MNSIGDESKIDTEERRYYQQSYQFQLQGFLLDEEEFEVKPAISRSLVMFGFDEKNREKEPKTLGEKVIDKVTNRIQFKGNQTSTTIIYEYKNNITISRIKNINTTTFTINGKTLNPPVMVNPGDSVSISITKSSVGLPSTLTLLETLVR